MRSVCLAGLNDLSVKPTIMSLYSIPTLKGTDRFLRVSPYTGKLIRQDIGKPTCSLGAIGYITVVGEKLQFSVNC